MSEALPPAETTPIVPQAPRDALNERFQRGLLHRGASYMEAEGADWRVALVALRRPEGPGEAERIWVVGSCEEGKEITLSPPNKQGIVVALAVEALPDEEEAQRLEEILDLPVVFFAPDGERGGPRGAAEDVLRELRGTLAYSDEVLAAVNPDAAYGQLRADNEARAFMGKLQKLTPSVAVTRLVILVCAAVWAQQVFLHGVSASRPLPSELLSWGAQQAGLSVVQPWRLLTAGFLHGGIAHLLINCIVLWQVGRLCERLYGNVAFAAVLLASIVGGFLASAGWNPLGVSVGASGGVFGACGAVLAFVQRRRGTLPRALARRVGRTFLVFVMANLLLTAWMSRALPIDHAGHVGGLLAGFLSGLLLAPAMPPSDPPSRRHLLGVPAVGVALVLGYVVVSGLPSVAHQRAVWGAGLGERATRCMELILEADALAALPPAERAEPGAAIAAQTAQLREQVAALRLTESAGLRTQEALLRTLSALEAQVEALVRFATPAELEAGWSRLGRAYQELEGALRLR